MDNKLPLVVIVGPTAVGKTDTAVLVAQRMNGEIVSADSMQIYKYMDIGSAKPTKEEMQNIKHYMIDEVEPDEEYSVACYQKRALEYIKLIHDNGKIPIVVGGTGLYVNSIVYPMDFTQAQGDQSYRDLLNRLADDKGNNYLYDLLMEYDPFTAQKLHPNDRKRIIRALEVYHLTGKPMSEYGIEYRKKDVPFRLVMIGLTMRRDILYRRINLRVDQMIEHGLLDEVKNLLMKGYDQKLASMQGLGYKELIHYLNGESSYEEAIEIIKRDTRRFAKRQFTWFNRDKRIKWFNVMDYDSKDMLSKEIARYSMEIIL